AAVSGAYGRAQSLAGGPDEPAAPASSQTFADMVSSAAADAVHTMRAADATMQAGLQGKVGTQQVVEATMALENTVKVSVAVRNKLVEAYQQIMQMQI
ncbi:flagellar biosynthesis protein, partial [Thioclava sp. BHET1]